MKTNAGKTLLSVAAILAGIALVIGLASSIEAQFQFQPSGQIPQIQSNATNSGSLSGTSSVNGLNSAATQTIIAAQGAGLYTWVTEAGCVNSSASTVTAAILYQGSTARAIISCAAAGANGGVVRFDPPLRWTVNTAVGMANTVAAASTYLWAEGYRTNN